MKYAKRCATHVATRRRKIRPGRDVIETYKTCAVSRRFYQKKSALLTSPPNPDRAHIDVDRFELELGSFRAPGTPIHPLGQSNLVTKGRGTPVGGRSPSNGYDSQSSTLVFVEPSMVVVAFPSTAWNGAGVAHEGGDRCYPTRHAPGLDGYGPTPAVYRGALALQKRRELCINQYGTLYCLPSLTHHGCIYESGERDPCLSHIVIWSSSSVLLLSASIYKFTPPNSPSRLRTTTR